MRSLDGKKWTKGFFLWAWFVIATSWFVLGAAVSLSFLPGHFDWRYCTFSTLSSASANPHGYPYCCLGLMASFGMGIPLCGYIWVRFDPVARKTARFGYRALTTGFLGAIAVGFERLFSQSISLHIHKAHEYVTIVTFFGLLLGIASFWICLMRWLLKERKWPVWALIALSLISVGPILGTGVSQAYLYFIPNDYGWVSPEWAELGIPLYLSFAFWEWLTCAGIFVYLFLILLCLPKEIPTQAALADPRIPGSIPGPDPA